MSVVHVSDISILMWKPKYHHTLLAACFQGSTYSLLAIVGLRIIFGFISNRPIKKTRGQAC